MTYVITFLLFAGIVLVLLGLREAQHEAPEAATVRLTKLRSRREELSPDSVSERERDKEFIKQEEQRAAVRKTTFLPSLSKFFSSNVMLARLEEELVQVRSQWRASELLAASVMLGLLVFIVLSFMGSSLMALPVAIGCIFLPWLYVKQLRAKYYRQFDEQLADTLMLVSNSLKAGFSFLQSIEMVAREAQPPIADEFGRVTQEIAVGVNITDALDNLGHRINSMDLNLMITAVLIQREIGGSLAEILETIAAVIRERLRIKGEIRTLTTQGRATGAILGCLPIGLGILLHFVTAMMAPDQPSFVYPLISTAQGQMMLLVATFMQIMGFICIWKIVSIKV